MKRCVLGQLAYVGVGSRTPLPHYHRCCCVHEKGPTPKVSRDGYLRGTCPIMLVNNVSYDCETNLEKKAQQNKSHKLMILRCGIFSNTHFCFRPISFNC